MRALLAGEDRVRFERLVAEVEQAVWEMEGVTVELARLVAAAVLDGAPQPPAAVELTGIITAALRELDGMFASRSIGIDVDASQPVFVMADAERLEHLVAAALTIAAAATPANGRVQLRFARARDGVVGLEVTPYRCRDPRASIVDALARTMGVQIAGTDVRLAMQLQAAAAT